MTKTEISGIVPVFIVKNVPTALEFYRDSLRFEVKDADGYVLFFGRTMDE